MPEALQDTSTRRVDVVPASHLYGKMYGKCAVHFTVQTPLVRGSSP